MTSKGRKNWPNILLWGAAVVATANLCVYFPELAVLFQKAQSPTRNPADADQLGASILGYTRKQQEAQRFAIRPIPPKSPNTTTLSTTLGESYFELQDEARRHHNVNTSSGDSNSPVEAPADDVIVPRNEFTVTHEEYATKRDMLKVLG